VLIIKSATAMNRASAYNSGSEDINRSISSCKHDSMGNDIQLKTTSSEKIEQDYNNAQESMNRNIKDKNA
jgi:hypothetical protein